MHRSIRWRLQFWYGLLLIGVVSVFGAILYVQGLRGRLREIDADLLASANYLDTSLRRWPVGELGPEWVGRGEPPRMPRRPPPPRALLYDELTPPGWGGIEGNPGWYYAVWRHDGSVVKAVNLPEEVSMEEYGPHGMEAEYYQRGPNREVVRGGPRGSVILVGRSTRRVFEEQRRYLIRLILVGLGVVALGLAGGYWVSSALVRPIARISETASRISADNLSERIPEAGIETELSELVEVLNGTFDRLEGAFAQLARFTADASHELRTPLAVLRSQAELALARPREAEEYRQALASCLRAGTRMSALVEGLLLLARADAGRLDLQRDRLDLGILVEEEVDDLEPLAAERGVRIERRVMAVEVMGDEVALARVVRNLVENGIRYNRREGTITVEVAEVEGRAQLTVADTGCGIGAEDLPHVFERFYRVDQARDRDSGGSGLGLAICQSIVEAHRGTITVESELDRGTTFRVELPIAKARRREQIQRPERA